MAFKLPASKREVVALNTLAVNTLGIKLHELYDVNPCNERLLLSSRYNVEVL